MHHPMTPIELIASALSIVATGAMFWWGAKNLIAMAADLYERFRPVREEEERKNG